MTVEGRWFASEGLRGGRPLLLRGRQPASLTSEQASKSHLLCIDWRYDADHSGLPDEAQYKLLTDFERHALDPIEGTELVLALVETGDGRIRYYCYVSDVDQVAATIGQATSLQIELSAIHDPDWSEYMAIVQRIKGLAT